MLLTGGQIIAEYLIREKVPYLVGIPGHGNLGLVDAFRGREDKIKILQVRHEQSAVHLADAYYRISGQPLAVFTSIGPGAINTAIGLATAYVDSTAVLALTGDTHTHMFGRGVLQEIERGHWANFPRVLEPLVKRYWQVTRVDQLPFVLHRAFNQMLGGRRGPVLIDLPMDVQCDSAEVNIPDPVGRHPPGVTRPDPDQIEKAGELLLQAERPVILVGGGVIIARAWDELKELAEFLGAVVVTTVMGKSAFPEDHALYGWHPGSKGTYCGNKLSSSADVLLAVGCRFADQTTSSYKHGVSFSIPPTKLIHIDLDPAEIGKNYPVQVGIIADAKQALRELATWLKGNADPKDYMNTDYYREIQDLKAEWFGMISEFRYSDRVPVTISRFIKELQEFLPEEAIVVTSSGNAQAQVFQEYCFVKPKTNLTTGGFSTMGFTLPASLGAKLAAPDTPVIGVVGDGDMLMALHELATAVQYDIPIVIALLNNIGWIAIKDLQMAVYGDDKAMATEFAKDSGDLYTPNFADIAEAFGAYGERIERAEEVKPALERAFASGKPAVIEVMVNREFPYSGGKVAGWWDVPVPTYMKERRKKYEEEKKGEKLT